MFANLEKESTRGKVTAWAVLPGVLTGLNEQRMRTSIQRYCKFTVTFQCDLENIDRVEDDGKAATGLLQREQDEQHQERLQRFRPRHVLQQTREARLKSF